MQKLGSKSPLIHKSPLNMTISNYINGQIRELDLRVIY